MYTKFSGIIALLFLLASCDSLSNSGQTDNTNAPVQTMEFSVNEKLLAEPVQDSLLQIQYAPPKGWNWVKNSGPLSVRAIYSDTLTKAGFSVIDVSDLLEMETEQFLSENRKQLKEQMNLQQADSTYFSYGNFHVVQHILMNQQQMYYRLEYRNVPKKFLINFFMERNEHMEENLRKIESTIGSIQLLSLETDDKQ